MLQTAEPARESEKFKDQDRREFCAETQKRIAIENAGLVLISDQTAKKEGTNR